MRLEPTVRQPSDHEEQVDVRVVSRRAATDRAEHRARDQPGPVDGLKLDQQGIDERVVSAAGVPSEPLPPHCSRVSAPDLMEWDADSHLNHLGPVPVALSML